MPVLLQLASGAEIRPAALKCWPAALQFWPVPLTPESTFVKDYAVWVHASPQTLVIMKYAYNVNCVFEIVGSGGCRII